MIHDAQVFISPNSYSRAFASFYRRVLPALGHRHAKILTVSEFSADQLVRYGVAERENIVVVANGVDHVLTYESQSEILNRLGLATRQFVVGLANVQVHKNIGLLLKAFAAPALGDLKLVLIGAAVREQFEALGHFVPPNVIFAGQVSDGELRALLRIRPVCWMPVNHGRVWPAAIGRDGSWLPGNHGPVWRLERGRRKERALCRARPARTMGNCHP